MKKITLFVALMILAASMAPCAKADSTASFSLSGTYDSATQPSALTAPGQNFTFDFTLPMNPTALIVSTYSDAFYLYPTTVSYGFEGTTTNLDNTLIAFYTSTSSSQPGGFFLDYCTPDITCLTGDEYQWTFAGPQQFTGTPDNPTLTPTSFSFSGQPFTLWENLYTPYSGSLDNGSAACGVVPAPEPSALVLLVAGMFCVALFAKYRS